MATIIDSYSETNYDSNSQLSASAGTLLKAGQSFTGNGATLSSISLYLKKEGTPTGTAVVSIYAHSGTYGTSSLPTGTALATSDTVTLSGLSTSYGLVSFTFSGANQIVLTNGTNYVLSLEGITTTSPNYVTSANDTISPTHPGNFVYYFSGAWNAVSGDDIPFYVYGDLPAINASLTNISSISNITSLKF